MDGEQRFLARHALGLPCKTKRSYRNRYFAVKDTRIHWMWSSMAADGMAINDGEENGMVLFSLTERGARSVLDRGERLCKEDFPGHEVFESSPSR